MYQTQSVSEQHFQLLRRIFPGNSQICWSRDNLEHIWYHNMASHAARGFRSIK
jgi:hypothetical protein